ncbi:MAG: diphosphate--fructose-6-phosphate 1-phosphotransferase [Spirochaetales bacterium]|jgi:pyrophosphate--fructose-6-phosphate 1-phosphotransferase|nr:diphosphate--fructose-6-phosphate 1-phosphotransferase [Spirochaetales bacterium]
MKKTASPFQIERYKYLPQVPLSLQNPPDRISFRRGDSTESVDDQAQIKEIFPHTYGAPLIYFEKGENPRAGEAINVGVVLSGGQAPGGHNVIAGLFDALKGGNPASRLFGFLGGPEGIITGRFIEITQDYLNQYRNTGGFDIIGSGRTKLETPEQFEKALAVLKENGIGGLVIIGGDDSNTNAALLAEYSENKKAGIRIVGVPKTIDGDLKNKYIESPFGFDSATKTYAELIGNIMRDAKSAKKYWHFIRLMGRSASHIALECALQTHPNYAIISEEVQERHKTLSDIVIDISDIIMRRWNNGEAFGVVIVPEGVVEFIPEMKTLIQELSGLLAEHIKHFSTLNTFEDQSAWINKNLSRDSSYVFSSLPNNIQRQLLIDRDPHGNVQVSRIETEKMIIEMVESRINECKNEGKFKGSFHYQSHFFGYEGRCTFPSNFDANYCYSLGYNAFIMIACGLTSYISSIQKLAYPVKDWVAGAVPITMMMNLETRRGRSKPVIRKALVDLEGIPFRTFLAHRDGWADKTSYCYPGAIQYFGPPEICDRPAETLLLEAGLSR